MNYQKIIDWCCSKTDGKAPKCIEGRPIPKQDIRRIIRIVEETCIIFWRLRQPGYNAVSKMIQMPCTEGDLREESLFALAHEYGHARHHKEGTMPRRISASLYGIRITRAVIWEELRASLFAGKFLLEQDLFHPKMIRYGLKYWSSYLYGALAQWADRRRLDQFFRAEANPSTQGTAHRDLTLEDLDRARKLLDEQIQKQLYTPGGFKWEKH